LLPAVILLAAVGLGGCGGTATIAAPATSVPALPPCTATVASALGEVAQRIYRVAAGGEDVAEAVGRVRGSSALRGAIEAGDARAAGAALRGLLLGQIVRIEVLHGGRMFASAGSGAAIAPVHGAIPGTNASYLLSVQARGNYVQVAQRLTGAKVKLTSITAHAAAPQTAGEARFAGAAFPSGSLRISVLVAPARIPSCTGSPAQLRAQTLGRVGERIYGEERDSSQVSATLSLLEHSTRFEHAVAEGSASATRDAIVGFFEEHLHVVRVRVTVGGRLLVDVGGPYVLAPVHGTLRESGRVVGQFEMAIQDDAGYLKLARLFTGAQVLMRVGSRQVMGTLSPGPAQVPARGPVSYGGRNYEAYSFAAEAFPSGPLRISLLF
jgi:hypothetical protein